MHPKHVRRLYISIMRSRIDYASFLYDNSCKTRLLKLDRIQNQALRIIGSYIRSTPIHVMENDLCLPPLFIRRKFLAGKFLLKAKSFQGNKTLDYLNDLSNLRLANYWTGKKLPLLVSLFTQINSYNIHSKPQLEMFSLNTWISDIDTRSINTSIPAITQTKRSYDTTTLKNICNNFIENEYSGWYKIYTDGSKEGSTGGAAFLDQQIEKFVKFKVDANISIMYLELIAIAEAMAYIESLDHSKFVILSDSKSSLQHLTRYTSPGRGCPMAYEIYESIMKLQHKGKCIAMQWIPSHIQLEGNEKVDLLAKQALVDGIPLRITPLHSDYIAQVKEHCWVSWQEYFDERSREKGIWYRTIQCEVYKTPWIDKASLNKPTLTIALRLRSGHVPTNKFGFLMKKVPSPNCPSCNVIEDVHHILLECNKNVEERRSVFGNRASHYDIGLCNSILANPTSGEAKLLYKLIR